MNKVFESAKVLYDYLNIDMKKFKCDLIIGLGCMNTGIPKECARLYKEGYGEYIVFSGNVGKGTKGVLNITEAERFKKIAIEEGVPESKIILEQKATNTYENYKYSKILLDEMKINYDSVIVVHKPYVKRRCLAIADVELSNKNFCITSQNLTFEEFVEQSEEENTMSLSEIINELVGEINNILNTPKYGIQSKQEINDEVIIAYQYLLENHYNKYLLSEEKVKKY